MLEDQIITILSQYGFGAIAFFLMYRFATQTVDKLKDAVTANTLVLEKLKTLIETKLK